MPQITNRKVYKEKAINIFRMFPGDPTGLPDDFFSYKCSNIWGGL